MRMIICSSRVLKTIFVSSNATLVQYPELPRNYDTQNTDLRFICYALTATDRLIIRLRRRMIRALSEKTWLNIIAIEAIDLIGGGLNELAFSIQDILQLSDETNDLFVYGDDASTGNDLLHLGGNFTDTGTPKRWTARSSRLTIRPMPMCACWRNKPMSPSISPSASNSRRE